MRVWLNLVPLKFYWNNQALSSSILKTTVLCNDSFLKWKKINPTNLKKNQLSNGKEMDYHWLHPACVRDDGWPQSCHWFWEQSYTGLAWLIMGPPTQRIQTMHNKFYILHSIRVFQLFFCSYNFDCVPKFKHCY